MAAHAAPVGAGHGEPPWGAGLPPSMPCFQEITLLACFAARDLVPSMPCFMGLPSKQALLYMG